MRKIIFLLAVIILTGSLNGQSLYSDIKAHAIGDVLSVIIEESANANRESKSSSSSNSKMNADASASGNVADFLPILGGSTSLSTSYDGDDGTAQADRLNGRITVQITERTESGMYKIKGERSLNVNGEENIMLLEGMVRPRDISTNNSIYSYNIANAQITYKKGGITNMVNDGFFSNIFVRVAGLAMVAISLGYLAL